jgi:hypothetical protein
LAGHADDKRWKEVFFLVLGMLPDASSCLLTIKQEIDGILAEDQEAQKYLVWLDEKNKSLHEQSSTISYLFYLFHSFGLDFSPYPSLNLDFSLYHSLIISDNPNFSFKLFDSPLSLLQPQQLY